MTTTRTKMTADDLWRMPDDGQRHELIRGALTTMAPAGGGHGGVAGRITVAVGGHVLAKRLGEVLTADAGFLIERDPDPVRAPDVAFISKDRVPAGGLPIRFIPFAPDIAVEVLSPADSQPEVDEKTNQWLAAGTAMVWIVNPLNRTVAVHRSGRDPRVLREADTLDGQAVCPGFSVKVAEIFER